MNNNRLAIIYDLDGTLADGFVSDMCLSTPCGIDGIDQWNRLNSEAKDLDCDPLLYYMWVLKNIINDYKPQGMPLQDFYKLYIDQAKLFPGIVEWFDSINEFGKQNGLNVEHFVVSSGVRGLILALPFADKLTAVFANDYFCDKNNNPIWLSSCVSATGKTEFVYRISKGSFEIYEMRKIFEKLDKETRYVKFDNIVYIGDGETDIPSMKVVKKKGGTSIAVFTEKTKTYAQKLQNENRVNFIANADYRKGSELYKYIQNLIIEKSKNGK